MEIHQVSHHRLTVHLENSRYLALRTGVPARGFAAQRVSAAARSGATLVRGDRFEPWPVRRVITHDGELYLMIDEIEGVSISEALVDASGSGLVTGSGRSDPATAPVTRPPHPGTAPEWLPGLLRSISSLARHEDLSICNTMTSLVTAEGHLLVLSTELADAINVNLPAPFRKTAIAPYRPERREDADLQRYTALTIAYHALCGATLCPQDDPTRTARCHASSLEKAPVHRHAPTIRSELAKLLDAGIASAAARDERLLDRIADMMETEGVHEDLSEDEAEHRRAGAAERLERNRSAVQRRRFWQQHGRTVILAAAAAVVLLAVPISILRNVLEPPATAGMEPREVAATFYTAWNSLDHALMEDTVARGVARDRIREITNVYVIDRVQMARQWETLLMPAPEWLAAGRPTDRVPYGVSDLRLELASQGAERAAVRAEYAIWRPESVEQDDGSFRPVATRTPVVDTLELVPTETGWEIAVIGTQQASTELIDLDMEVVR